MNLKRKVRSYPKHIVVLIVLSFMLYIILISTYKIDAEEAANSTDSCGRFPKEEDIFIDNLVWQVVQVRRGFLKLLNAYYDDRHNRTIVRINASGIKLYITVDEIYCQFWFDGNSEPLVVKATEFVLMWMKYWSISKYLNHPYLITCPIAPGGKIPASVSITAKPYDKAENNLKVINNHPVDGVKKMFGVCSKQITYENREYGIRFIEWVHMLRLLGADKIHFYNRYVHPEFYKVLEYLDKQGFIKAWPYLEPKAPKNTQKQLLEMNMLNDCFYRIKNLYEYVIILDTDEVIMPVGATDMNWFDMFKRFTTAKKDAICSEMTYYPEIGQAQLDDVPKYHYMLQHIQRSTHFTKKGYRVKCFLAPQRIVVAHIHYAFFCYKKEKPLSSCKNWGIPTNTSQVSHYRNKVPKPYKKTFEDKLIWKFKDELIKAVNETLIATNFKP